MLQNAACNQCTFAIELLKFMFYQSYGLDRISKQSMENGQVQLSEIFCIDFGSFLLFVEKLSV